MPPYSRLSQQSELSKAEQVSGVSALLHRITTYQPRIVCFVGLGIADIFKVTVTAAVSHDDSNEAKFANCANAEQTHDKIDKVQGCDWITVV